MVNALYTAGNRLPGSALRDRSVPVVGLVPADITVNNSTDNTPIPGLGLQLEGTTHYGLDGYFAYTSNTTADIAFVIFGSFARDFSTVAEWSFNTVSQGSSNPGSIQAACVNRLEANYATGSIGGTGHATLGMTARPKGWVYTTSEPGHIQFYFRQNTADVSNTTLKAGSWLRFTKLGPT